VIKSNHKPFTLTLRQAQDERKLWPLVMSAKQLKGAVEGGVINKLLRKSHKQEF
jgi:hypothetical protein